MKRIKIFLASSNELVADREKFEIEVYRKCKAWFEKYILISKLRKFIILTKLKIQDLSKLWIY